MYAWMFVFAALTGAVAQAATPGMGAPEALSEDSAVPWRILEAESVFAVVTRKGGFAARLAHNHFVVARDYLVRLDISPARLDQAMFDLEAVAHNLVVDDPGERERWEARVVELGLVDDLGTPDESDRAEIRETMLSEKQLDAASDPRISISLLGVTEQETVINETVFPYRADIAVRIHGETVTRGVVADFSIQDDRISVEAVGRFTFEEFGIEPYSAFMGSVKNQDEFFFYLNLQGVR